MADATYFSPNVLRDAAGDPAPGGKVRFFETGTTTPITVYADQSLTTAHPPTLVADSSGILPAIWTDGAVQIKVDATDSDDVGLPGYPIDPVIFQSSDSSASNIAFDPTARISSTNVQDAVEEVDASVKAIEDRRDVEHTIEGTGGSGNAFTISPSGVTSYSDGDTYLIKMDRNNTGPVTINVNSLGPRQILRTNLVDLGASDLYAGEIHEILYSGASFVILTPTQPTTSRKGGVRKSSSSENIAGTSGDSYPTVGGTKEMVGVHGLGGTLQSWEDVTGSRSVSTNYQNSTGSPIQALVTMTGRNSRFFVGEGTGSMFVISGRTGVTSDANATPIHSVIVPDNWYYRVEGAFNLWSELR